MRSSRINPINHKRTKKDLPALSYLRSLVQRGVIRVEYVKSENMVADFGTKVLSPKFEEEKVKALRFGLQD